MTSGWEHERSGCWWEVVTLGEHGGDGGQMVIRNVCAFEAAHGVPDGREELIFVWRPFA